MTVNRTAAARFLKGPFTLKIASGTLGVGSGRVTSQAGLTPAINCVITNGTPAATGCSAKYPAYTEVTLTATPAVGFSFSSWGAPCAGTGTCKYTAIQGRTITASFAPSNSSSFATRGRWETPVTTPVVGIHVSLLPTGKVLLWGREGESHLWDPANPGGGFVQASEPYELFCSGHSFLADGRLLVVGGHSIGTRGIPSTVLYDPPSGTWTVTGSMAQGRYYPTTTVLPNGEVLAVSGTDETQTVVTIPEIGNGLTWRRLTTASLAIGNPFYPAMFLAPNGKVFLAGFPQTSRYLDVSGTGAWTTVADRQVADRRMGSAVMYAPGKVLYVGGGDPPTSSAEVIDLNQSSPSWRTVPGMAFVRRQLNATILADGQVLVTHGTSGSGFNDVAGAIRAAELWNPATETWSTMANESRSRTYHSAALLLPDARVLSSGSGEGGGVSYESSDFTAQVFTPPYLFDPDGTLAERPTITSAPTRISYGGTFTVESPDAGSVTRGTLVRLSSVTHAFNQSQLIYPLAFAGTGSSLTTAAPTGATLAPPGPYMLFLVNGSGVPSTATMVTVGP
jgi:WD40 repeat protein